MHLPQPMRPCLPRRPGPAAPPRPWVWAWAFALVAAGAQAGAAGGGGPVASDAAESISRSAPTTLAPSAFPATPLPAALRGALRAAGIAENQVSLLVFRLDGSPPSAPLVSHLADQPRPVASVMKLFTTGVALLQGGPAASWHTDAGLAGTLDEQGHLHGNLVLRGSGDPALVVERATQMLTRWQAAGLRHIDGDLVLDRSAFALPPHDPAAFDGATLKPYNAGPDALMVNQQAVTLRLAPDAARPGRWQASLEPALAGVTVVNRVQDAPAPANGEGCVSGDWRDALQLALTPTPTGPSAQGLRPWQVTVSGKLPVSCGLREWPLLWTGDGPGDHAARTLLATWQALGGTLKGVVRAGPWPANLPVWQSWRSPPLTQVVWDINKFSNNVMARQLMLSLPRLAPPKTALDAAPDVTAPATTLEAARAHLSQAVLALSGGASGPCGAGAWVVDNGSGLSREERSSAACLGRWLQRMWASPAMPEWLGSLPIVGLDGTTRRWTGPAEGQAHIKTGSLDGVATMAGVVDTPSGQRWAVVAMGQHPQGSSLRAWYGQVLAWVTRQ